MTATFTCAGKFCEVWHSHQTLWSWEFLCVVGGVNWKYACGIAAVEQLVEAAENLAITLASGRFLSQRHKVNTLRFVVFT